MQPESGRFAAGIHCPSGAMGGTPGRWLKRRGLSALLGGLEDQRAVSQLGTARDATDPPRPGRSSEREDQVGWKLCRGCCSRQLYLQEPRSATRSHSGEEE